MDVVVQTRPSSFIGGWTDVTSSDCPDTISVKEYEVRRALCKTKQHTKLPANTVLV
jgi:hypothetical protein